MPGETTLQRALREAAILYGPEPRETIMNPHFVRAEREPPTFLDGLRGAAQRLNRHPQEGLLQDDHTVADQPDYVPRGRDRHFHR